MTGFEERLRDALTAKAETVRDDGRPRALPAPRARPSSARWWAPLAVAAAIVLTVTVTFVATRSVAPAPPAARPTPHVGPFAPPVEQVWPNAVHEIPTTAPGNRAFKPDVFVTDRIVVGRGLSRNRPDSIWSYDVDKRRFTRIARLLNGFSITNEPVVFGHGYVAWSALVDRNMEIWAVPVTGGVPRRLAAVPATITSDNVIMGADRLAIADGAVVWSPEEGGVYRLPLKGGQPTLVSGTRGFYLAEWPWAGWPRNDSSVDYPIARSMEHLKNVLTGETRNATPPAGRTSWDGCGVMWCFNGVEAWRRDGTARRALPGSATSGDLYSGRYVLLHQRDIAGRGAAAVHDLVTGRTGLLFHTSTRRGDKAPPTLHPQQGMIWYQTGRGTQVLLRLVP